MIDTDFDIPQSRLAESAERVLERALEDARRREHSLLTNEHVCLAFAEVEWDLFGSLMQDLQLNPHEILHALEEHMQALPPRPNLVALIPAEQPFVKHAVEGSLNPDLSFPEPAGCPRWTTAPRA